jgi:hypothetical protein
VETFVSSDKLLHARCTNAQGSADPKTEHSKGGCDLQATRHLHAGNVVVLPAEDIQAFDRFTGEIVTGFAPETAIERHLAQLYAAFQWRIHRAAAIEDTMFAVGMMEGVSKKMNAADPKVQIAISHATTFRTQTDEFEKISRYSQSLVSQAAEILGQLKQLQYERKEQHTDNLTSATLLYQFHRAQNQSFDPKQSGLDITIDQIEDHIRRVEAQKAGFEATSSRAA